MYLIAGGQSCNYLACTLYSDFLIKSHCFRFLMMQHLKIAQHFGAHGGDAGLQADYHHVIHTHRSTSTTA